MQSYSAGFCGIGIASAGSRWKGLRTLPVGLKSVATGYQVRDRSNRMARVAASNRRLSEVAAGRYGIANSRLAQSRSRLTLAQLCERLGEAGVDSKVPTLWHQMNKWNLSLKKTLHASEQERPDVQKERLEWRASNPPSIGRSWCFWMRRVPTPRWCGITAGAPKGQRCVGSVPYGHWKTTTFLAGLRQSGLDGPAGRGRANGWRHFRTYIETFLCPTLQSRRHRHCR